MVDLMPTDYASTGLPFGASNGDINLGYQWRFVLSPGQMVNVAITYRLAVPEPSSVPLVGLGLPARGAKRAVSIGLPGVPNLCFRGFCRREAVGGTGRRVDR